MSFSLEVRGLDATIAKLAAAGGSFPEQVALDVVQKLTLLGRRELQQAVSAPTVDRGFWGRGSPAGDLIGVRTGELRRSISPGVVYRSGPVITGSVGTNKPQMKALETGETIRPTAGKYLRIPTKYAQTPAGVDRNAGRSLRDVPGTFIRRSKKGALFIWGEVKGTLAAIASAGRIPGTTKGTALAAKRAGQSAVPLYMLATEVKMPEKRTFRNTQARMQPLVGQVAGASVRTWIQQLAVA